jgi:hypothetical protein
VKTAGGTRFVRLVVGLLTVGDDFLRRSFAVAKNTISFAHGGRSPTRRVTKPERGSRPWRELLALLGG